MIYFKKLQSLPIRGILPFQKQRISQSGNMSMLQSIRECFWTWFDTYILLCYRHFKQTKRINYENAIQYLVMWCNIQWFCFQKYNPFIEDYSVKNCCYGSWVIYENKLRFCSKLSMLIIILETISWQWSHKNAQNRCLVFKEQNFYGRRIMGETLKKYLSIKYHATTAKPWGHQIKSHFPNFFGRNMHKIPK